MAVNGGNAIDHGFAFAGLVADAQLNNGVSKLNKGASNIDFGKGVVTDGDDGAKLPTGSSTAKQFNGVVKYELNRAHLDSALTGATPGFDMTVVTHGVVWVLATETVVKDEDVFLRIGATNLGDFSNAAGTGVTASVAIVGAKFLTSGDSGELVKISLGLGG